jgi:hypothetical protein
VVVVAVEVDLARLRDNPVIGEVVRAVLGAITGGAEQDHRDLGPHRHDVIETTLGDR